MSNITHFQQIDKTTYLSFSPFEKYDFLFHGFLLKKVSDKNLGKFLKRVGFKNSPIVVPEQIHSKKILTIKKKDKWKKIETDGHDGILADVPGIVLTVRVADCLPIFLVDPLLKITGLIHAGWKGTLRGIVKEGISKASQVFGSNPEDLIFVLGPCIRRCCYEISESLAILFPKDCLTFTNRKIKLDLVKANLKQLLKSGVKRKKIFSTNLCTFCHGELLYSYRRDKDEKKRMTAFIGIK